MYRLRDAFVKFCRVPHRFVCLTNRKLDVETQPLLTRWQNWWPKLELFQKDRFAGPVRYFDLDTVLRSDISDILAYPHEFTTGPNWKHPESIGSAFLAWDGREDLSYIPAAFDPERHPREYSENWQRWGDQAFLHEHLRRPVTRIDDIFPGRVVSFKYHCKVATPPAASIVMFHGRPRPAAVKWRVP